MDHIRNHLRLLGSAIREGNRPAASALAGDMADIFAAFRDDASAATAVLQALPIAATEDCRQ